MSQAVDEHRAAAPDALNLAVMTVSDSRTMETDTSGALILSIAEEAGHRILERVIVPDEPERMTPLFRGYAARDELHAVLVTGGTGISPRDQTYETVTALLTKQACEEMALKSGDAVIALVKAPHIHLIPR